MGLFGKAVDARTRQVLRNEFGFDVEFDFVAGGVFSCDPLGISIKPFMAAVGDEGVFFIHEGRVVLILTWAGILSRKPDIWGKGSELQIVMKTVSKFTHPKEFPYCYWHKAEISFNNPEDHEKFMQIYSRNKYKSGFTEQSLILHNEWMQFSIGLPVSQEDYMKANQGWGTEESRLESYKVWGLTQDSQRFLYFVGRSVCQGLLPGVLIQRALSVWLETEKISSSFTGKLMTPNESFMALMEKTEVLTHYKGDPNLWGIGSIEVAETEWKSEIPTFERLAAFDLQNKSGNFPTMLVWSDFHQGNELIAGGKLRSKNKDPLLLMTSLGSVSISGDERKKFAEVIKQLDGDE